MAVSIDIATFFFFFLQILLLFSASHVRALKAAAQTIHNDDAHVGIHQHPDEESHMKASNLSTVVSEKNFLPNLFFTCPQAIFVFGDSLSDTGNVQIAFPGNPLTTLNYPYGESYTFTNEPGRNRYCDGRIVPDFIAQAFGFPFIEPILLENVPGFPINFTHGVNFAYAGATAEPNTTFTPVYLELELEQFFAYKAALSNSSHPPTPLSFVSNAAYLILEIGGDDFFYEYQKGVTPQTVLQNNVSNAVAALVSTVKNLIQSGAKTIIVGNQPPQGCNPAILTANSGNPGLTKDSNGCLIEYNQVDIAFNSQLQSQLTLLQDLDLLGITIIQFDFYSAILELITNPAKYGFNPSTPLQVCCGFGGEYNYNPFVTCGNSGNVTLPSGGSQFVNINTAPNPQEYIQWDGVHFTQAAYKAIATFLLEGRFVIPAIIPGFNLAQACNLNFSQF
jgi:phospholipase/lecithinase/hemolysin